MVGRTDGRTKGPAEADGQTDRQALEYSFQGTFLLLYFFLATRRLCVPFFAAAELFCGECECECERMLEYERICEYAKM